MGLIGDFAKAILILTVAFWLFLIVEFSVMGQIVLALFLLLVFLIPLSMVLYERRKYRKRLK
jgi:Flp pilus assembly protein TadB